MNPDEHPAPDEQPALPPLPDVQPYPFLQAQADENAAQAKSVEEFIADLRTNPLYRPWFEQFHPDSLPDFIQHYALAKQRALQYGASSDEWLQERITEYTDAAYQRLWDIQQKKLFDLQCRWRAEQAVVPGVVVSAEFVDWSNAIHRCPFLEPITPPKFNMYCQFVATTPDFEEDVEGGEYTDWQDYEAYKAERADDSQGLTLPAWYDFYDARRGTGLLLDLPDLRGAKEEHYCNAHREANRTKHEKSQAAFAQAQIDNPPDPRPRLSYADQKEKTLEFARRFEPGKVQRLFEARERASEDHLRSGLADALETLQNAHEDVIAIEANADWQLAIIKAAADYRRRRLLEALPVVYEQYQTREELGIAHPALSDYESKFRASTLHKKWILKGRKLLGEPRNFDF